MLSAQRVRLADRFAGGPKAHLLFFGRVIWGRRALRPSAPLGGDHSAQERSRLLVDTNRIARTIEPSLAAMGYRLVRVVITSGRRATLQVMAERVDDRPMTVDDCAEISRSVSALLDVADPIADAYMLEVSSPGIDRPLVRPEDYDRFRGFEARIELAGRSPGASASAAGCLGWWRAIFCLRPRQAKRNCHLTT